ncbi:hypothetical protein CCACVL1_16409 [Corchorus capsularis]|uniref:Late embryogenesis abundant protein, LEA-14 n=1 Tax=Corchorus capsularis TaxID=210143 RepID=A0A1R3HX40_COCAP|nr:hypothetical protein CCACVL1_16409 [Corchorus capsularis]
MEGRNRSSESCVIGIPAESCVIGIPADTFMREQPPPPPPPPRPRPRPRPDHQPPDAPTCDFLETLFFILIILAIVALCVWGILELSNLGNNPKFGLNSLSVSNLNISGSEITGIWDVEFLAKSPDFLYTNNYPRATLAVYYQNQQLLLGKKLPRIHLPKKTTISYRVNALAMATSIQDKGVADAIANEWSQQKVVAFTVTLQATDENGLIVNVVCARIKVGFSSSSSQGTLLQESSANTHRQAFSRCSNDYYYL